MGMDNLVEDVQSLTQQCNGTTAKTGTPAPPVPPTPAGTTQTPETGDPGRGKTAVVSSTPQRGDGRGMPSLDESPVLQTQRLGKFSMCKYRQCYWCILTSVQLPVPTRKTYDNNPKYHLHLSVQYYLCLLVNKCLLFKLCYNCTQFISSS